MSVPAAFLGVVMIWATTPLAIKWSSDGPGYIFGVASRITISATLCLLIVTLLGKKLEWHRTAVRTYLGAGLGIYASLLCVYLGAQYVTSGVISVLFGLMPIITSLLAFWILSERSLTPSKVVGMLLGFLGLVVIFGLDITLDEDLLGLSLILLAVALQSLSAIAIKREGANLPALSVTSGGLLVSLPLYLITWFVLDGHWPEQLPIRAVASILYLAIFGSVAGFFLYFYILRHSTASTAALVTLITPVLALLIGREFNDELVDASVWAGASLILLGLACHQWGGLLLHRFRHRRAFIK